MKKLFDFKMACSVLLMLAISFASCKQDLTVQPNPLLEQVAPDKVVDLDIQGVQIKDGILHFKDAKSLNEALKIFGKSNYLYAIRLQYGRDIILFKKAPQQGVEIKLVTAIGPICQASACRRADRRRLSASAFVVPKHP